MAKKVRLRWYYMSKKRFLKVDDGLRVVCQQRSAHDNRYGSRGISERKKRRVTDESS